MNNQAFIRIRTLVIIIFLVGGGILLWQYFQVTKEVEELEREVPEISREEGEEFIKLTLESIKNAEYYFALYDRKFQLVDGQYGEEEITDQWGFSYTFSAGIINDKVAFGDLNDDGKEDAAVIIYSSGGSSGLFYELAVMINQDGNPYHLTSKYLGDRIRINSLSIQEKIITLEMIVHDLGDAACCPTLHKVSQYKLSEDELLEI